MFAIIDIETTGGKQQKITEICVLIHDGLSIVDKFTTLINPECPIPPFISRLTNITNEMVADAPKFYEIAKKLIELTENKIFVAHNVSFDYGVIQQEYKSLGYNYRREKLCTVRLSRKLLPHRLSYSLGNLCDALGIENNSRHRAEGDAVATAQLFELLMRIKSEHPGYRRQGITEINTTRIDSIKKYILDKLPETTGVYYFQDKERKIIYIGKSTNMYNRALSHFNSKEHKGKKMLHELYNVDFVETGSELIALLLESNEIKKHTPRFNRARKKSEFTHCIDWFKDPSGILRLHIVESDASEQALQSFNSYFAAREKIEQWIDEHLLCLRYCGLTEEDSVCFHHQIKKCNGICCGEENNEDYNKRAQELIDRLTWKDKNFLLFDTGRNPEEQSLILIENGHYAGYGYVDNSCSFSDISELRDLIKRGSYYPDQDVLVRSWLKDKPRIKKMLIK